MGLNGLKCLCFGSALWILAAYGSDNQVGRESMALSEEQKEIVGVTQEQAEAIAEARAEQKAQDLDADEKRALDLALEALGREVNLSKLELTRQRVYAVEWPDSSLGCPQKGRSYLQVVTPGYLVSLTANGESYTVHVGAGNAVVCKQLAAGLETRRLRSQYVMKVYRAARVDLAGRLKIDPSEITVTGMTPVTWDDSSLGCPQIGKEYKQTAVQGFVIKMECRGRRYEYHSDIEGNEFVSCHELESCHETD